jgi:serine/threonine protein kinase
MGLDLVHQLVVKPEKLSIRVERAMSDLSSGPARPPDVAAAADRAPSRVAGRYDLGEVIGVGAPAWVYRAEDRETGRAVAVKLYPTGFGGPDRARRQRDLGVLSGLHHPHLVELLDAGDESGRAYLVMELVEGRTLAQRMLDGPMAAGEVARLGADLGYALAYLHSRGIIHRAVKPANVLLGDRPMLTDFGIAALVDRAEVSRAGSLVGSPAHLAPEQVNGGEVGMPADVYALGLILLEALTGRREFEGDGPETALARLSRRPSIPEGLPALTDLLHAMTAMDPAVRPTSGVVSEALRAAAPELDGVPSVRPPTPDDERWDRRISTLERLESLDTLETPGTLRSPGRLQIPAARDNAWKPQPPASSEDAGKRESPAASDDAGKRQVPAASDDAGKRQVPAAGDDAGKRQVPAAGDDAGKREVPAALDDSGTKLLDMPPAPAGLPLPPSSWTPPERRDLGRRRLLAGVLGLTGLAAATVGVLASQSSAEVGPVPADGAVVDQSPVVPPVPPALPTPLVAAPDSDDVQSGDGGDTGSPGGSHDSKKRKGSKHSKKH